MLGGETGLGERDNSDRGIPDRRDARLNPKVLGIIDEKAFEIAQRLLVERMILRIIERAQGDDRVQHRRENRREPVAPLADPLDHPAFRFLERALAQDPEVHRFDQFERAIGTEEKVAPGERALIALEGESFPLVPTG